MALRSLLSKRLSAAAAPAASLQHPPLSSPAIPAKSIFYKEYISSPEPSISRRFLHRRAMNPLPEFLPMPVGEDLTERLKSIAGDRIRLDGMPAVAGDRNPFGVSVDDARKILRVSRMEKVKLKLRQVPASSIQYGEFVKICIDESGNEDEGLEFAKALDLSGNVIVLGNIVFLRPEQVAKSIENIISHSLLSPNDPRREQLQAMEQQKTIIDQKARAKVRAELYGGLGFLAVQTLGFMRLTFWELSWDVMEPICFFVTSFHFALAYVFFIRTSVEPSFEGYFQRRFRTKQKKLMKIHNFDLEKYTELRKIFYPNMDCDFRYKSINRV